MQEALLYLFPDYKEGDWLLQDDANGKGPYIRQWNRPEPQPTPEQIDAQAATVQVNRAIAANTTAVQAELDRQAQAKGYDGILSACSYASQPAGSPFQAEGAAFLKWRSDVWAQAYATLADVQAGTTPMPTPSEAVAQMPALVLP